LILAHQNDLKTQKILIWSKEKNKKISNFFKNAFETQKQTGFYETQLKKHVKTTSQKLRFKPNFLVGPAVQNTIWFVTKHLAAFVAPQTQKQLQNKRSLPKLILDFIDWSTITYVVLFTTTILLW